MPVTCSLVFAAEPAGQPVAQTLRLTNSHGFIAIGTGKSMTLQRLAEVFGDAGA